MSKLNELSNVETIKLNAVSFKTESLLSIVEILLNAAFRVFINPNEHGEKLTYFTFSDGLNIGYCQGGDYGYGVRFSTVNIPCKECGTGFSLQSWDEVLTEPTLHHAQQAFIKAPEWANWKDVEAVRKFESLEQWFNKENILKRVEVIK